MLLHTWQQRRTLQGPWKWGPRPMLSSSPSSVSACTLAAAREWPLGMISNAPATMYEPLSPSQGTSGAAAGHRGASGALARLGKRSLATPVLCRTTRCGEATVAVSAGLGRAAQAASEPARRE